MNTRKIPELGLRVVLVAVGVFILAGAVLSFLPGMTPIPSEITGDLRVVYAWARTDEGVELVEQVPCYCGCGERAGHEHVRGCFWMDDGSIEDNPNYNGKRCSICVEIAMNAKMMHEDGKDICEIRASIDSHYEAISEHGMETPMPDGC